MIRHQLYARLTLLWMSWMICLCCACGDSSAPSDDTKQNNTATAQANVPTALPDNFLKAPPETMVDVFQPTRGMWKKKAKRELKGGDDFFYKDRLHMVFQNTTVVSLKPSKIKREEIEAAAMAYRPSVKPRVPNPNEVIHLTGTTKQTPGLWRLKDVFETPSTVWFQGYQFKIEDIGNNQRRGIYTGNIKSKVNSAFTHGDGDKGLVLVRIQYNDDGLVGEIKSTPDHRFYVLETGTYEPISSIPDGTTFLTADNKKATLVSVKEIGVSEQVYNLEVEHAHNYHVKPSPSLQEVSSYMLDSNKSLLVHNECEQGPQLISGGTESGYGPIVGNSPNTFVQAGVERSRDIRHIALGLSQVPKDRIIRRYEAGLISKDEYLYGVPLLKPFAKKVGALDISKWNSTPLTNGKNFRKRFDDALQDVTSKGGKIKFNLDEISTNKLWSFDASKIKQPTDELSGQVTLWELQTILRNPNYYKHTEFYIGGSKISPQDVSELGLNFKSARDSSSLLKSGGAP